MSYGESFRNAFKQHQASLNELEKTLKDLNVDLLADENMRLSNEKKALLEEMEVLKKANQKLGNDLESVRGAYREQVMNEKLNQVHLSKSRVNLFFQTTTQGALNRLSALEASLTQRMRRTVAEADKLQGELKQKYTAQINVLQNQMNQELAELRQQMTTSKANGDKDLEEQYGNPELGAVDDALMERLKKGNSFELKLGLNLINKLGVILIFLAVILAGRYTYGHWFNDYAKGITFYALGLIFCAGGEWLHRRRMPAVAAGVIGGGIGLFYASTFICTFYLNILSFNMAMLISVLIAGVSLTLTLRYKSPTIGLLSLVGGYLPFFTYVVVYGIDSLPVMQALIYLMGYNLLVLGISVRQKWPQVIYVGFLFNMPCVHFLLTLMDNHLLAILFAYINFLIYLGVALYRNLKERSPLNTADIILVSLNTLVNCSMVYHLFTEAGYGDYDGLLALFYAGIYFGLALMSEKLFGNKRMINTFYTFAVAFSILVVPLQLSQGWIFFGWVIEAGLYIYLGRLYRIKPLEVMGLGLLALSHLAFIVINGADFEFNRNYPTLWDFKYGSLIAAEIFAAWVYWRSARDRQEETLSPVATALRYPIAAHISLFLSYEVFMVYRGLLQGTEPNGVEALILVWGTVVLCNLAYQRLKAEGVMRFSRYKTVSELIVYTLLIGINFISFSTEGIRWWLDAALLVGANGAILWRMNRFLRELEDQRRLSREIRALVLGGYTLVIYFINLTDHFRPVNLSVVLNISMIFFALLYITLGFKQNFVMLRRMGLILSLLATVKMLIIDSLSFSLIQKIISYFIFGLVLIGISVVYQRITARIAPQKEEDSHEN